LSQAIHFWVVPANAIISLSSHLTDTSYDLCGCVISLGFTPREEQKNEDWRGDKEKKKVISKQKIAETKANFQTIIMSVTIILIKFQAPNHTFLSYILMFQHCLQL